MVDVSTTHSILGGNEMARIRKNMYEMSFGQSVGILMNEELMKKMAKIQYETQEKIIELLENNPDSHVNYGWSIAEEPSGVPQDKRTLHYIDRSERYMTLEDRLKEMFDVTKVKDLYDVGSLEYNDASDQAKKEHTRHLKSMC